MADARLRVRAAARLWIGAAILAAVLMAGPVPGHPTTSAAASIQGVGVFTASAALVPRHGAMWGAWAGPGSSAVSSFEATIKRRLDIVHQYHAWNDKWPTSAEYSWAAGGRIIFGNISARTTNAGVLTWHSIATGAHDADINAMASRLKAFGRSVFVSFDQEPESRLGGSGFAASDFVNASRRIHNLFAAAGVHNVVWVWNVSGSTSAGDLAEFKSLYPGDSYVDWVAWDPYNWNTCIHPYGWRTFDQTVSGFYNWLAAGHLSAGSAGKPYMLAEYGSVEASAGAKGNWFRGEAATLANRPRIKAVVYFNENKDCNWPITTSSSSVAGFAYAGLTCWVNRALPSPPGSVTATAGSGAATVKWAAAKSVCPISTYTISTSPGGKVLTVSGKALSAKVTGLTNGTGYSFAVRATSANGTSGYSARSSLVTPFGGVQATPGATPTAKPSAAPTPSAAAPSPVTGSLGGGEPTPAAAVVATDAVSRWLESHLIVIPAALAALILFGLGGRLVASRRRRGG